VARFCFALRNVFCSTRSDPTISLNLTFAPLYPLVLEQVQGCSRATTGHLQYVILPLEAWIESAQGRPCLNERIGEIRMALVRLLIVDDFRLWQECVQAHLEGHPEVQIVGFASNGLEALQKVGDLHPDLVFLDISLPKLNGIETARKIRQLNPRCKIIFLTGQLHPEIVLEALEAGGWGYVYKEDASTELLLSLESVRAGKRYLSTSVRGLDDAT
jgi:CheY-like chemotaxis protein